MGKKQRSRRFLCGIVIACDKLTIAWMGNPNYPSQVKYALWQVGFLMLFFGNSIINTFSSILTYLFLPLILQAGRLEWCCLQSIENAKMIWVSILKDQAIQEVDTFLSCTSLWEEKKGSLEMWEYCLLLSFLFNFLICLALWGCVVWSFVMYQIEQWAKNLDCKILL